MRNVNFASLALIGLFILAAITIVAGGLSFFG